MSFFEGLYSYEVILLLLGAVFFVVLMGVFVVLIVQGKPYGKLLMFFSIPVIMIGFPGIRSIQYKDGVITLDKLTHELQQNPADSAKRAELTQKVDEMAKRPSEDPGAIAAIGSAQFALGDHAAAEANLDRVIRRAPGLPRVQELRKRVELDHALVNLATEVEQHPSDTAAREKLKVEVEEAAKLKTSSPQLLTNIARAQQVAGNPAAAVSFADRALKINPNLPQAQRVRTMAGRPR